MLFTTSWDDGTATDLRIADLLQRHGCTGTFYVCPGNEREEMLAQKDLQRIASDHEIGAHTISHPRLTRLPETEARFEIVESKKRLEDILQTPCTMFCYPKGDWNPAVRNLVVKAGYLGARTTEPWRFSGSDPWTLPTSIQIMPFPWRRTRGPLYRLFDPLGPLRAHHRALRALGIGLPQCRNWLTLARALFLQALKENQPFFHLWGHSREVERFSLWKDMETFLAFVAEHDVVHVPNSGLLPHSPS